MLGVSILRILGISGLPTWKSRNKMTFGCIAFVVKHKKYYKEEGGDFL
jgi:hypothetical protein